MVGVGGVWGLERGGVGIEVAVLARGMAASMDVATGLKIEVFVG